MDDLDLAAPGVSDRGAHAFNLWQRASDLLGAALAVHPQPQYLLALPRRPPPAPWPRPACSASSPPVARAAQQRPANDISTVQTAATIAQTGWTRPVTANGTPNPLKAKASVRFWFVFEYELRPISWASITALRRSPMITTSAASIAMSVPAPTAIPTTRRRSPKSGEGLLPAARLRRLSDLFD